QCMPTSAATMAPLSSSLNKQSDPGASAEGLGKAGGKRQNKLRRTTRRSQILGYIDARGKVSKSSRRDTPVQDWHTRRPNRGSPKQGPSQARGTQRRLRRRPTD